MLWRDYVRTLPEPDHKRLIIALGAGLQEARKASEIATTNGEVEDAREHVFTAMFHLLDVVKVLGPSHPSS